MSDVENGGGHPVPVNRYPGYFVPPERWSAPYPSLVCMQCQERSLIQPVLPSAPYLVSSNFEDISYPISPYDCRGMSSEIQEDGKFVASFGHKSTKTSPAHNVDVTPTVTHGARANETMIVSLETENEKKKSKRIDFSKPCWIRCPVLVLLAIGGCMFISALAWRL